jgi:hypothetical protein
MMVNPYQDYEKIQWQKGNFHVHAGTGPGTCGAYEIEEVLKMYNEYGFKVISITNHDIFSDTSALAEKYGMVLLGGFEYSQASHMLCIGVNDVIRAPHQEAIDRSNAQGGFVVINHPNWKVATNTAEGDAALHGFSYQTQFLNKPYRDVDIKLHWDPDALKALKGFTGLEIYNGVITRLMGAALAVDVWDRLLSEGKRVWGFGNDDFHRWFDFVKVATVVGLHDFTSESAMDALKNGRTYVSTGLKLDRFDFDGKTLTVETSTYNNVREATEYRFIGQDGRILRQHQGNTYAFTGDEMYVRVEAVNASGAQLWTQPIYDDTRVKL